MMSAFDSPAARRDERTQNLGAIAKGGATVGDSLPLRV